MLKAVLALNELDTVVFDSPNPGAAPRIYSDYITVPDAHLLFNGEFKRVGTSDLKIVGEDGQSHFIAGYFAAEKRAHLASPEGATLSPQVVEALAGPLAPGQYAQAGAQQPAAAPVIGRVDALTGSATVVRNGVTVALNIGDTVRRGDVVQTSGASSIAIVFSDGTTFNLSANARMVLDNFVYAAGGTGNSALVNLVQGTFSMVAGQVAKTGDLRVETPVATMGIRGTAVLVEISASDGQTRFSVMVEPDGTTGSFNLYNKTTGALIATVNNSQIGWLVSPAGPLQVVAQQQQKTPAQLQQELGIIQQIFTIFNNNQQNPFVPQQGDQERRGENPNDGNPQTAQGAGGSSQTLTVTLPAGTAGNLDPVTATVTVTPVNTNIGGNTNTSSSTGTPSTPSSTGGGLPGVTPTAGGPNIIDARNATGPQTINGTPGPDTIYGSNFGDTINAGAGDDIVLAGSGNDIINGGPGNDVIHAGGGDDVIDGGDGDDQVFAGSGNDTIIAAHGGGNDFYDGGEDIDTIKFESAAQPNQPGVTFNLNNGTFNLGGGLVVKSSTAQSDLTGLDVFIRIEKIVASPGNDIFILHDVGDWDIDAGLGTDIIRLANGIDILDVAGGPQIINFEILDLATDTEQNIVHFDLGDFDGIGSSVPLRLLGGTNDLISITNTFGIGAQLVALGTFVDPSSNGLAGDPFNDDFSNGITFNVYELTVGSEVVRVYIQDGVQIAVPGAQNDQAAMTENQVLFVDVVANDMQGVPTQKTLASLGTVTITGPAGVALGNPAIVIEDNQIRITPGTAFDALAAGETATITIPYTMTSGTGGTFVATATVTVTGTNDAPYFSVLPDGLNAIGTVEQSSFGGVAALRLTSEGANQSQIEAFLGLNAGTLDTIEGDTTDGAAIAFDLALAQGETVSFSWNFASTEYEPFNDYAFVSVAANFAQRLSDVFTIGDEANDGFLHSSGWQQFTYTANAAGQYRFGIGVMNEGDTAFDSFLYISGFSGIGFRRTTTEDGGPETFNLLNGAFDPDTHDVLTATNIVATGTDHLGNSVDVAGAVTVNGNNVTIDPAFFSSLATGQSVTVVVNYEVSDGHTTRHNSATLVIQGADDNTAPVVSNAIADQSLPEDTAWSFTVPANTFSDVDGDTLTYSATLGNGATLPAWLSFNPATQTFSGTPPANFNGSLDLRVTASDGTLSASDTFVLAIAPVNDAPVVSNEIANQTSPEDTAWSFTVPANTFSDIDGDTLTYSATLGNGATLPAWLSFNPATQTFSGTPPANFNGSLDLRVTASDGTLSASDTFTLAITPDNDAPVVSNAIADPSSPEDTAWSFTVPANTFSDIDGDTLTYSATLGNGATLPAWLSFNPATQTFSGTPPANFNGSLDLRVTASDGTLSASDTFTLAITPDNDAPVVSNAIADQSSPEDTAWSFTVPANTFSDIDGDALTYSATLGNGATLPAWLSFNPATQTFSGTPPANFNGSLDLRVTASDGTLTTSDTFSLTITPVNDAPVITNATTNGTVSAGAPISSVAAGYLTAGHALINGLEGDADFGEGVLPRNDDGSTGAIDITSVFKDGLNFFRGADDPYFTAIYINNNGNITFGGPLGAYTPTQIEGNNLKIIAPFWADVDTFGGATSPTPDGHSTGSNLVYYDLDAEHGVVTITWDDVGYYSSRTDKLNAFQLQLIDRGDGNFDIVFRYEDINWTTGNASGGSGGLGGTPARAGYTAGDGNSAHYFELFSGQGSTERQASMLALEDTVGNTGIAGVHVFEVRSGGVGVPTSAGTIAFSDADPGDAHTVSAAYDTAASSQSASLGALNVNLTNDTTGGVGGLVSWQYVLDPELAESLAPGTVLTEVFNVTISDGHGGTIVRPVVITVNGPVAHDPQIHVGNAETFEDDGETTLSGITVTDADADIEETFNITAVAQHGTLETFSSEWNALDEDASPNALEFHATLSDINAVLRQGLVYTDPATYTAGLTDMVTVTVTDANGGSNIVNFIFNVFGDPNVPLTGTAHRDIIFSSDHSDTLTGGAEHDIFRFEAVDGAQQDVITDFVQGEDQIALYDFYESFEEMVESGAFTNLGGNQIALGNGHTITLQNFPAPLNALTANDFIFHTSGVLQA